MLRTLCHYLILKRSYLSLVVACCTALPSYLHHYPGCVSADSLERGSHAFLCSGAVKWNPSGITQVKCIGFVNWPMRKLRAVIGRRPFPKKPQQKPRSSSDPNFSETVRRSRTAAAVYLQGKVLDVVPWRAGILRSCWRTILQQEHSFSHVSQMNKTTNTATPFCMSFADDVVVSLRGPVAALVQPKTLELSALELARDQAYPGNEWAGIMQS